MPSKLRPKLTYANVMATVAVFLALGGGAMAAVHLGKNSVGTKQIKNGAVTGQKVASNTLTGANINASTLGTVPNATHAVSADSATNANHATNATHADNVQTATNADHATNADNATNSDQLGGIGSVGFIQGSGSIVQGYQSTSSSSSIILMTIPNLGNVKVDCAGGAVRVAFFPSVSGSLWFTHGGAIGYANGITGTQLSNQATDDVITAQFATSTQTATMVISGHPGATCTYAGQAIVQS